MHSHIDIEWIFFFHFLIQFVTLEPIYLCFCIQGFAVNLDTSGDFSGKLGTFVSVINFTTIN
jgi:hypothetical protein